MQAFAREHQHRRSLVLSNLLLVNGGSANAVCALTLFMVQLLHVLFGWTILLLEDRVSLNMLELGLEPVDVMAVGAAVGTTSSIGELVPIVLRLGPWRAPIAFASTLLLHLLWVGINVSRFGEIARKMLDVVGGAVSQASVVTIILLVRTGHGSCVGGLR